MVVGSGCIDCYVLVHREGLWYDVTFSFFVFSTVSA